MQKDDEVKRRWHERAAFLSLLYAGIIGAAARRGQSHKHLPQSGSLRRYRVKRNHKNRIAHESRRLNWGR